MSKKRNNRTDEAENPISLFVRKICKNAWNDDKKTQKHNKSLYIKQGFFKVLN